jgi:choline dehydrogenase-like flavoprotein
MIIDDNHYDVIVIGSGAAGGTLAGQLAAAGKAVLLLERGGRLDLADQNVADVDLFRKDRYHPGEQWFGPDGDPFFPQTVYALGGNTKIWGGVLERMREQEFTGLAFQEGVAPDWGLRYSDLEPYYTRAEKLFRVHGEAGVDPSEPPRQAAYAHEPRPIEPFMQELKAALERQGTHPYHLPQTWSESSLDPTGDSELFGIDPACTAGGFALRDRARVRRLHVNPSGTEVRGVEAEINTAEILLRSATEHHSRGLCNGSDQVGRNLMKPQLTSVIQLATEPNSGRYARSLGITDYYWGDKNVSFPLGSIATGGGVLQDALFAESPPVLSLVTRLLPNFGLEQLAARSVSWWAMSAVLPDPHNRITLRGNQLQINYLPNNREAHDRLVYRWIDTLKQVESDPDCHVVKPAPTHPRGEAPLTVMGSVCGTCRMGANPATSVVDLHGRSHELSNLYIADASILPSCPAVGLGLTVIANALRIADQVVDAL